MRKTVRNLGKILGLLLLCLVFATSGYAQRGRVIVQDQDPNTPDYVDCDPNNDANCTDNGDVFQPDPEGEAPFGTVNNHIMKITQDRADTIYITVRKLSYVLAGLGALTLVILAAFGKFQWKWFFMLLGGLFILAGFQSMINFLN